jgi:iduronate 2-sulfatase
MARNFLNMPKPAEIDEHFKRRYLQAYLACISYMDACAGRVLAAIDEADLAKNTIVVFLGDHGYQMGEHDSWGHKHSNYETSTRAPLLIAAPGKPAAGQATSSIVEFLDLYPTLVELAGLPSPTHLEGTSIAALLINPQAPTQGVAYSEMQRGQRLGRALRTADFRYVEWTDDDGKMLAREMYDHRRDPQENTNVAAEARFADKLSEFSAMLAAKLPLKTPAAQGK